MVQFNVYIGTLPGQDQRFAAEGLLASSKTEVDSRMLAYRALPAERPDKVQCLGVVGHNDNTVICFGPQHLKHLSQHRHLAGQHLPACRHPTTPCPAIVKQARWKIIATSLQWTFATKADCCPAIRNVCIIPPASDQASAAVNSIVPSLHISVLERLDIDLMKYGSC